MLDFLKFFNQEHLHYVMKKKKNEQYKFWLVIYKFYVIRF